MPRYAINTLLVFVCCWGMVACVKKESTPLPTTAFDIPVRPAHFPPAVYRYGANVYSREGFELGRKLFFDPRLSISNTISCGSCHKPKTPLQTVVCHLAPVFMAVLQKGIHPLFSMRRGTAVSCGMEG